MTRAVRCFVDHDEVNVGLEEVVCNLLAYATEAAVR